MSECIWRKPRQRQGAISKSLAYFRHNPYDIDKCELVVAIDGELTVIPFPRKQCINAIWTLLTFVEKIPPSEDRL